MLTAQGLYLLRPPTQAPEAFGRRVCQGPALPRLPRPAEADPVRRCSHGATPLLVLILPTQIKQNVAQVACLFKKKG